MNSQPGPGDEHYRFEIAHVCSRDIELEFLVEERSYPRERVRTVNDRRKDAPL